MRAFTILCLVSAGAINARTANAQAPADRRLLAARDTVWRAFFANDTAVLRRYLPPAAATLDGGGDPPWSAWSSRAQVMESARRSARIGIRLVSLTFSNTEIVRAGHSALLHANYEIVTDSLGHRHTTAGRATELFVLQGATWQNPYWQLEVGVNGAEREIELPDTLGANFAVGDSAKALGTPTDYDALVGTWEFRFQSRKPDGTFYPVFAGHWTFDKRPGGGLIEDRWRPDDPSTPIAQSLYTTRTFEPKRRVWQMIGSSSSGGVIQPGLTWSDGADRYAIQRNGNILSRIRYLAIEPNSFLWRMDVSSDGGRTWLRDAGAMTARRIAR